MFQRRQPWWRRSHCSKYFST